MSDAQKSERFRKLYDELVLSTTAMRMAQMKHDLASLKKLEARVDAVLDEIHSTPGWGS